MKRSPQKDEIVRALGPGGPLSTILDTYEYRDEQLHAAQAVMKSVKSKLPLLLEAGTGVGKTLAYLVPALVAISQGKRVVVSTYTLNLQSQLIEKDIPLALSLMPEIKVEVALLKGRGNYLCLQDLDAAEGDLLQSVDPHLREVKKWARRTQSGDVSELPFRYAYWSDVAANIDSCRHQECLSFSKCFYYQARFRAAKANLVVVNHSLYLHYLAGTTDDEDKRLLPEHDIVVFDEAHHLEDVATDVFGVEVASRDVSRLSDRLRRIKGVDINPDRLASLDETSRELFALFNADRNEYFFDDVLTAEHHVRLKDIGTRLCVGLKETEAEIAVATREADVSSKDRLEGYAKYAIRLREHIEVLLFNPDPGAIRWGDRSMPSGRGQYARAAEAITTLYHTPISVAPALRNLLWASERTVVLCSATLANSGGFAYVRDRLGVPEKAEEAVIGSPFNYKRQAMLYVPHEMPTPPKVPSESYTDRAVEVIERVVALTEGRAFMLFTSRRMLEEVYARLAPVSPFPLLRQGDAPAPALLEKFRQSPNACLLGNQTFWEGVDVQGAALSCVIIDRIPFAVPNSPITRARTNRIKDEGGDWFRDFSIPQAQIRLKQGFGRLVRTKTDCGIVCVLDSRLIQQDYGAEFVRYLPPASRASKWARVEAFWKGLQQSPEGEEAADG